MWSATRLQFLPRRRLQSPTPVKTLRAIRIGRRGAYWRFDFDANAFLHHMVRNLMACLLTIGSGRQPAEWMAEVLARAAAMPPRRPSAAGPVFRRPVLRCRAWHSRTVAASDWLP